MTRESPINPELAALYLPEVLPHVERLLSQMDREEHSLTYGSFDRDHWSWKFRDFPLGMLQSAIYPLALLWRFPYTGSGYHNNPRLLQWITAAVDRTLSRQHHNGAFDAFSPNERDPGPTIGVIHGVVEAFHLIRGALPGSCQDACLKALRKACDFALVRLESHAFVSNHWGLFAKVFLDAYELLKDEKYSHRANEIIDRILHKQSEEGWYQEYEGPDPGYESLGIFHLAMCWNVTRSPRLLESLRRSVAFYAYCVHPDGSAGGVYGSRHTALYFPGGFEILAGEIPMAAAVARFMRERLSRRNVVTPAVSDAENLAPLMYTYLEACRAPRGAYRTLPALPCETFQGHRQFARSGITVAGSQNYYAVVHLGKGGVCRIFDKHAQEIAYQDAGYLVHTSAGRLTSQLIGFSQVLETTPAAEIACTAQLAEVHQELPTPWKFILLRLLNLTVFRSQTVGAWVRRRIVARLILVKRAGPLRLTQSVALPRSFTAIHMGSAKYFHATDLEPVFEANVAAMAADLNRSRVAQVEFTLEFSPAAVAQKTAMEKTPMPEEAFLQP
jgi:hypothetical protein